MNTFADYAAKFPLYAERNYLEAYLANVNTSHEYEHASIPGGYRSGSMLVWSLKSEQHHKDVELCVSEFADDFGLHSGIRGKMITISKPAELGCNMQLFHHDYHGCGMLIRVIINGKDKWMCPCDLYSMKVITRDTFTKLIRLLRDYEVRRAAHIAAIHPSNIRAYLDEQKSAEEQKQADV